MMITEGVRASEFAKEKREPATSQLTQRAERIRLSRDGHFVPRRGSFRNLVPAGNELSGLG